jgi:GT2 family glycosyltransferase
VVARDARGRGMVTAPLPVVVVPVFNARAALDACLAALERSLPADASVRLVDDASSDPQIEPLARGWCQRSRLDARYQRTDRPQGLARCLDAALAACVDSDVVVLKPEAEPTAGWLQQLTRCASAAPRAASISAWSNDADLCSFPRPGEPGPAPGFPEVVASAAASIAWGEPPELPAASGPCVFLRRAALRQLGGLDCASYAGARVLDDFCRRAAAMGWRNLLCPAAFVLVQDGAQAAPAATGHDLTPLLARWPDFQELLARFILSDSLRPLRERLQGRLDDLARSGPQRDLFN